MTPSRASVEERAARYQRRYTGPWATHVREFGPVEITYRQRRRLRREWAELNVAGHDLWKHTIWRGAIVPVVRPLVKWLAGLLA